MGKISEKAKFIDLYASRPVLSFGKDGKVYSRLGLLLTLLTIIIIGGMAIFVGIRIFGRHTPSFIQYQLPPQSNNPIIPFNTDDFKFGMRVIDLANGEENIENKLFVYSWSYYHLGQLSLNLNKECKFSTAPGENYHCFYQDEESKDKTYLDFKEDWEFFIQYKICQSEYPDSPSCLPGTYSREYLKSNSIVASILYEDLVIDPFNYENPLTLIETGTTANLLLDIATTLYIELNEVEFTSDNGWIFEDLKTEKKLKASTSLKISGRENQEMLRVQLIYGGNKTVYKRTYPKIQDFLAQISGLITIITPIFIILVHPFGNLQAVQHMVNEIYEIKLNKSDKGNSPQKPAAAAAKKKRRSSSKSKANSLTSPKGTEGDLLPPKAKKVKSKTEPPSKPKSFPFAPHAALVIGGMGKLPTREEDPPIPEVPEENTTPFRFETFEKSPSSPFKSSSMNESSPQKALLEHAITGASEEQKPEEEEKLNQILEPIKVKEEVGNQSPVEKSESESESEEEEEEEVPLRTSDPLEVPLQGWLQSFWKPTPEVQVLNKAREHIMDTFDLVTLSKKVIEIDKLKACLFTHDQRVIFENLPSSVIVLNPEIDLKSPEAVKQYHWKDSFKGDEVALKKAYSKLKETKNQLDQLLIKLYESEYIADGFRQEE